MEKQTSSTIAPAEGSEPVHATKARSNLAGTATRIPVITPEVPEGSGLPNFVAMGQRTATYWMFIVLSMLVGAMITRKMVKDRKFTYKSEAVLIYRGGMDGPPTADLIKGAATRTKELLLSQNSLKKIIKDCQLAPGLERTGNYAPMIEGMRLKIEFKPRAGDTFSLSYEGNSAFEAQLVVKKLAEALIDFNNSERKRRLKSSLEFNIAERKKTEERMLQLQKQVARFLADHPSMAGEQLGTGALVKAEIKKHHKGDPGDGPAARGNGGGKGGGHKRPAQDGVARPGKGGLDPVPAVDPVLIAAQTAARTERLAARKDLADKSVRYTEQHPDVRAATARVAAAESALAAAEAAVEAAIAAGTPSPIARPAPGAQDDPYGDPAPAPRFRAAGGAAGGAATPAKRASQGLPSDPDKLIDLDQQWLLLNRELQKVTQNYTALDAKVYNAQLADNTDESGYSAELDLLDPPSKPTTPTGPPNRSMLSVGLGVSIVIGVLLSIAVGLFADERVYASSEIDDLRVVPVIAVIPKGKEPKKKTKARPRWKFWA